LIASPAKGASAKSPAQVKPTPAEGPRRGPGGRPTRAEAERRHQLLLDAATRLFAAGGLDGISIETIADEAGVAKRFLYARYRDKGELFAAVVRRLIEERVGYLRTYEVGDKPVAPGLRELAQQLERMAVVPEALAIFRLVISEIHRFPALGQLFAEKTRQEALGGIVRILQTYGARGEIIMEDPMVTAELFFLLTVGGAQRRALIGFQQTPAERSLRIDAAVDLFLYGCARGSAQKPGGASDA
jgi:TetR/AcrR family transcriptional regulator, mexJK operon transcriptional repressor